MHVRYGAYVVGTRENLRRKKQKILPYWYRTIPPSARKSFFFFSCLSFVSIILSLISIHNYQSKRNIAKVSANQALLLDSLLCKMVTKSKNKSKPANRLFATPNVIRLLIIGSSIWSLLFMSRSGVWQQQWYDQQGFDPEYGAPTSTNVMYISKNLMAAQIDSAPGPVLKAAETKEVLSTTNSTSARNSSHSHIQRNKGCLSQINSRLWLEGTRFGNQNRNDSRIIDDDYVASSILNTASLFSDFEKNSQTLLKHTLCAKSSRFRNLKFSSVIGNGSNQSHHQIDKDFFETADMTKNQTIHYLSFRLLYLSVHVHQHVHATEEAKHRLANPDQCNREMDLKTIGKFDFECPDAKFLVVPMQNQGLGSTMRLIVAPSLRVGIASDRVVIFVNNSPVGPKFIRNPFLFSSCSRLDKQCFFLPDSPCVLTHDEVQNATVLSRPQKRRLFKTGDMPKHLIDERVVVLDMISQPTRTPSNFKSKIVDIARKYLIHPLERENPRDPILPLLSAAADHILEDDEDIGDSYYYFSRGDQAHHAMIFFAMRPKLEFADRIDTIVGSTLGDNHRTNLALGLPIRASDKCVFESECPSFETYMSLMQDVWKTNEKQMDDIRVNEISYPKNSDNSTHLTNIILTSESPDVFEAQRLFQERSNANRTNISFPFKFVTNAFDVHQNTGQPSRMESSSEITKEDILVSSLSSFKMQFYAKYNVGNCCSNFHILLFDFLSGGCGASGSGHVANCMQDHEDERYRICCPWSKLDECKAKREKRKENKTAT